MSGMDTREAAARLGIRPEDQDAFAVLADRMRAPAALEAELQELRERLEAVDQALRDAGIEYPMGARGVRDLANLHEVALHRAREAEEAARAAAAVRPPAPKMPAPGRRHPAPARVTIVWEVGDQIEAWQAEYPEDAEFRFDTHRPEPPGYPRYDTLPREPRERYRFGIDVRCGDSGCVQATTRERVLELLAPVGREAP